MARHATGFYWLIWFAASVGTAGVLGFTLFEGPDKSLFMPGQLSPGHHQLVESCASCHMPRIDHDVSDWLSRKLVDHNQSATLSPNSKMICPACLHCHGLGYAIDALADAALIERNFTGQPTIHVESIDLARADHERYLRERAAARE